MFKKFLYTVTITILLFVIFSTQINRDIHMDEKILLGPGYDIPSKISYIDTKDNSVHSFCNFGEQIECLEKNIFLILTDNEIVKYNKTTNSKKSIFSAANYKLTDIEYFKIRNDSQISFSSNKRIFLYDIEQQKISEISLRNANIDTVHCWTKDGQKLYYTDADNSQIYCMDFNENTTKKIVHGSKPQIGNNEILAYMNNSQLNILDLKSGELKSYSKMCYNYCLLQTANTVVIETDIPRLTLFKNILKKERVLGHSIVIWDYERDKEMYILESCEENAGSCFSIMIN